MPSSPAPSPDLATLKQEATLAERRGELDRARAVFEDLLTQYPSRRDLKFRLARILVRLEDKTGAESLLEQVLKKDPANAKAAALYAALDFDTHAFDGIPSGASAELGAAHEARLAMFAAWRRDPDQARRHGERAIADAVTAEMGRALRQLLAQRMINFGFLQLSDLFCEIGRADRREIDRERLKLRLGRPDGQFEAVLEPLLDEPMPEEECLSVVRLALEHRWMVAGPSGALLEGLAASDDGRSPQTSAMRIAVAMQLGCEDEAVALVRATPDLSAQAERWLPVAKALTLSAPQPDAVQARSDLFDAFIAGERELRGLFSKPDLRLAVVGNSPCEIGRGQGGRIDAHDHVLRFNRFSLEERFVADYGRKITLLARLVPDRPPCRAELPPGTTIIVKRPNYVFAGSDWEAAMHLLRAGHRFSFIPHQVMARITTGLHAHASIGIAVCAMLRDIRGTLKREDFFGFSFTDQTGPDATSSHYFERSVADQGHDWAAEKALFDSLFA